MVLSICIVNWNTRDYLKECLQSLYTYPPRGIDMQVVVVDNASTDGSAEMVEKTFPKVMLIKSTYNSGYAEGNNLALEATRGAYVLLLNPDVIVHKDALTRALVFMRSNPTTGALGCRLLSKDGSTQRSVRGFPDPWPVCWEYLGLSRLFPKSRVFGAYRMTYFDYERPMEVDQPMGSFLLISRKTLNEVGLMDVNFPIFFNEVDWCYRAKREKGWRIWYTPEVTVTHYGGASTQQVKPHMIRESHISLLRFYNKHYKASMSRVLYLLIRDAILFNMRRQLNKAGSPRGSGEKE